MMKSFFTLGTVATLFACGDSTLAPDARSPDAPAAVDAKVVDAPLVDAPPFIAPAPFAVPLSAAGPDQLQSAIAGPADTFYAAGFAARTLTGNKQVVVVKLTATGPVAGFGTGGVAVSAIVSATGAAGEIGLAAQPSGKIVVVATIANTVNPLDRDLVVYRIDGTTGALDTTFGTAGSVVLDLNTALDATVAAQRDASRGIAVAPNGTIYVLGAQRRAMATATDSDIAVVRLTVDGALDATFGTAGKFTHDIQNVNVTPRGIRVLPDGSAVIFGYATTPAVGNTVQALIYKITAAGALDPAFATAGFFHDSVLATQTETYNGAIHGNKFVTGGYGRESSAAGVTNDYISLRFDLTTGARDLTWGGAPNGAVVFDPSGTMAGNNCRNAVALPGGKTLLIGSAGPSNMAAQDAVFAVLDANGALDRAYGDGIHTYALGANLNDQFWGGAVSGNTALIVGYKGGGATPTDTANDDAWGLLLPLR